MHDPATSPGHAKRDFFRRRLVNASLVAVSLVVNVGGTVVVSRHGGDLQPPPLLESALLVAGPGLLWWRTRFPTVVLLGCAGGVWAYLFVSSHGGPVYLPMVIALVSAINHGGRLAAYALAAGTISVRLCALVVPELDGPPLASTTLLSAWLLFLLALGEVLRYRTALGESGRQRRLASMEAQADQIRREAAEQRLSLARELHDLLGHQLTVINVQAKAGLQLHRNGHPGVDEALQAVQLASGQALADVQAFLDGLRDPGEQPAHIPSPTLAHLDELIGPARAAGLDVELHLPRPPRPVPAPQHQGAGRTITESLTNVLRHAGLPRTRVRIDYAPTELTVRVDNAASALPAPISTGPGGGRGLEGMRQRLATQGGRLTAGPSDGHAWSVIAVLPIPEEHP